MRAMRPSFFDEEGTVLDTIVELQVRDGVRILQVRSEIDIANAATMERQLEAAAAAGAGPFIVCLQDCAYMDSTGLRPLMRLANRAGDDLYVVVPPKTQIRRIFELTHLHEQMHVCDSLEAALLQARAKGIPA